jgi:hypothetical protein
MTDEFGSLSGGEMRAIATALRSGRLSAPLSQLALAPYLGRTGAAVAPILVTLTGEGLASEHLAFFLDALAAERDARQQADDVVELVSTGPEAAGYPARDTRIVVRELFRQAEHSVLIAGYAVHQGRDVFRALAERMDAQLDLGVRMFLDVQRSHGDTTRPSEILRRFADRFRTQEWRAPAFPMSITIRAPSTPKRPSARASMPSVSSLTNASRSSPRPISPKPRRYATSRWAS